MASITQPGCGFRRRRKQRRPVTQQCVNDDERDEQAFAYIGFENREHDTSGSAYGELERSGAKGLEAAVVSEGCRLRCVQRQRRRPIELSDNLDLQLAVISGIFARPRFWNPSAQRRQPFTVCRPLREVPARFASTAAILAHFPIGTVKVDCATALFREAGPTVSQMTFLGLICAVACTHVNGARHFEFYSCIRLNACFWNKNH